MDGRDFPKGKAMTVHFATPKIPAAVVAPVRPRTPRGPAAPRPPVDLTYDGRLYAVDLARVLRVSKATLWAGLKPDKQGHSRFPQPDGRDTPHKPYWLASSVREYLAGGGAQ
jgi:hypothetical protein